MSTENLSDEDQMAAALAELRTEKSEPQDAALATTQVDQPAAAPPAQIRTSSRTAAAQNAIFFTQNASPIILMSRQETEPTDIYAVPVSSPYLDFTKRVGHFKGGPDKLPEHIFLAGAA